MHGMWYRCRTSHCIFKAIWQVCNTNPQYADPNTGQVWPYCSDICQAAANPQPQPALCMVCAIIPSSYGKALKVATDPQVCQTNPQYVDPNTGEAYAHCPQECRAAEVAGQQAQYSQQRQGALPFSSVRFPHDSWTSQQQRHAVTLVALSRLPYIQMVPAGITAVGLTNSTPTCCSYFRAANIPITQLRSEGLHLLSPG